MERYIDLHTHSSASDGTLSPAALVAHAAADGLCAIALTDHDTVAGLAEAQEAGRNAGLEVVCGIEMSADFATEMHILGYFIDPTTPALQSALQELRRFRAQRNRNMIAALAALGLDVDEPYILEVTGCPDAAGMGRVHMAMALQKKGYTNSVREGFDKYLRPGMPAYSNRQKFSPADCIALIRACGGVAVLAHPVLMNQTPEALDALVGALKEAGLTGMECYHSEQDEAHTNRYLALAKRHGLAVTGGSDFHGATKPDVPIGRCRGGGRISEKLLEELKRRWQNG